MFQPDEQKGLFTFYYEQQEHFQKARCKRRHINIHTQSQPPLKIIDDSKESKKSHQKRPIILPDNLKEIARNKKHQQKRQSPFHCIKPVTYKFEHEKANNGADQVEANRQRARTMAIQTQLSQAVLYRHLVQKARSEKKWIQPYLYSVKQLQERESQDSSSLKGFLRKRGKIEKQSSRHRLHRHKTTTDIELLDATSSLVRLPCLREEKSHKEQSREANIQKKQEDDENSVSIGKRLDKNRLLDVKAPSLLLSPSIDFQNWPAFSRIRKNYREGQKSGRLRGLKEKKTPREGLPNRRLDVLERLQRSGLIDKLKRQHEEQMSKGLGNRSSQLQISVLFGSLPGQPKSPADHAVFPRSKTGIL